MHYVICPYSKPEYLDNLLGSFQRQVFRGFKPIIVENGPAVGTFPREVGAVILTSEAHQSHAKNEGLRWLRENGDASWSVFDCDDYYGPEYLKSQVAALEGHDMAGKSFGNMMYVMFDDGLYLNGMGNLNFARHLNGGATSCATANVPNYPIMPAGEDGAWCRLMNGLEARTAHTGPKYYGYNRMGTGHTWDMHTSLKKTMTFLGQLPIDTINHSPRSILHPHERVAKVVMLATPDYEAGSISIPDMRKYCTIWDYPLVAYSDKLEPDWPAAWSKIVACLRAMNEVAEGEWVFWTDADMVMLRHTQPLETLIKPDKDFMISIDKNGICTGLFLIRNTVQMRSFFTDLLQDVRQDWPWEQDAMKDLLAKRPDYAERVGHIPESLVRNPVSRRYPGALFMHYWANGFSSKDQLLQRMRREIANRDAGRSEGRLFG